MEFRVVGEDQSKPFSNSLLITHFFLAVPAPVEATLLMGKHLGWKA